MLGDNDGGSLSEGCSPILAHGTVGVGQQCDVRRNEDARQGVHNSIPSRNIILSNRRPTASADDTQVDFDSLAGVEDRVGGGLAGSTAVGHT